MTSLHSALAGSLVAMIGLVGCFGDSGASEAPIPDSQTTSKSGGIQKAVLAGGCFWGVDAVFKHVRGVTRVLSGYSGGSAETARYDKVSMGSTGHAESVEITFDSSVVSYATLLKVFFSVAHNPTEHNRQGPDVGTQYRSAIFTTDPEQQRVAEAYIAQLNSSGVFKKPIATQVLPLMAFYAAEDYHQNFLETHPDYPYIVYNDIPKLVSLKKLYPDLWQDL
ncbi:MAG: peptide-methionine (S)-S-oxide reductase MsrA [Nitrospirota bacterium]|nr:peptide-methionine (S)-S-oxide reductase MsrA [Nitrospirota bacterium]